MKRRILAIFCVLATLLAMVVVPAYAAADGAANAVTQLTQDAENLVVQGNTYIDLNGHDILGVTVEDGTLYVSDSKTDDYTVADGDFGTVTGITGSVKAAEGYLAVTEAEAVSFHRVDLTLTSMTLRPAVAGVYYNSAFAADEVVAARVQTYGVALSIAAVPTAENLKTLCGYSAFKGFTSGEKSGTLLIGILKEDNPDATNNRNASMAVYGRAYLQVDGQYVFGACAKRSLKEQVEAIDAVFDTLSNAQQSSIVSMYKTFKSVMSSWNLPNISEGSVGVLAGDVEITIPVTVEDGKVTETVTVEQDGVTVTIPFGVLVESDELTLTVTKEDQTNVEAAEGQSLLPLDVHVDGLSAANTVPLTIDLGKVMPKNLNMGNYAAYHTEGSSANEMTLVDADEEFTAHNQYKYTLDGEITLHVATFSLFTLKSANANGWNGERNYEWYDANATKLYIRNADQLAGFGAIVGGMASVDGKTIEQDSFANKTVMLLADISIGDLDSENEYVFYPIGYWNNQGNYGKFPGVSGVSSGFYSFNGIFDGNGNTISDFYQNTWEMVGDYNDGYSGTPNYYRDGMGLFGKVYGGTVKNLTVRNFSCDSEHGTSGVIAAYADCGATFENIAIFDCNPRVYNIGNGGIVGCSGWYAREAAENKVTFRNITVDQTNKISALWDATGTSAGGILGQYYPASGQSSAGYPKNPGIHFENCHTAAVIEVNNDCCSNYHYYWYRYAGMLMGSVRANTKDENGYTVADTTGITAENCTYTYGNWNEYWYCELVKNTIASYTHDHQFGRLTSITDLSEITNDNGETWLKEGNFALLDADRNCVDCYHIFKNSEGELYRHKHDEPDETNPEVYETINGVEMLKEDRQRYKIPFGQLLTGDGMGVKAHYEFPGVEPSEDQIAQSSEKFTAKVAHGYNISANTTSVAIADLFTPAADVVGATVNVYISPVGTGSTVKAAAVHASNGTFDSVPALPIEGTGKAKITITDYYYCIPTTLYVTIGDVSTESGYQLVTDASTLQAGDKVVIVAADYDYAMGADKGNNREAVTVTKNENSVTWDSDVQVLTLEPGAIDGTFAFNTGSGYLYAASSSSNQLKTGADINDNASWQISTVDGVTTVVAQDTSVRNILRYNPNKGASPLFACYNSTSSVKDGVVIYKLMSGCACEVSIPIPEKAATCTEAGSTGGAMCPYCNAVIDPAVVVPALGHNWDDGVIDLAPTCTDAGKKIFTCTRCEETDTHTIDPTGHNYVNGVCANNCGIPEAVDAWVLVTDVKTLAEGDKIVIVAKDYDYALSTNQKSSNRGAVAITKSSDKSTITIGNDVQIITLKTGISNGTFAFDTGSGYLYAASSSGNQLKTKNTLDVHGSWGIAITNGVASITAPDSNNRNVMQYNPNNGSPLFACYDSASQKALAIYKQVGATTEPEPETTTGYFEKVTTAPADWSGTYLIVYEGDSVAFNGGLTTLDAESNTVSVAIVDGKIEATSTMRAAAFTINSDGFIKSASGYYIGQTSNANGLNSSTSTTYANTLSLNTDGSVNIVSGGAYLRYNSAANQYRFRYYKSSSYTNQKAITLYKLVEAKEQ